MSFAVHPDRDRLLHRLATSGRERTFRRGALVFRPGGPADHVILVRSGHLLLERRDAVTGPRIVDVALPGELTGIEPLWDGPEATYRLGARAGEASRVVLLPSLRVRDALSRSRVSSRRVREAHLAALDHLRAVGAGSAGPGAEIRLGRVLRHLAARVPEPAPEGEAHLPVPLTHATLGALAGLHRSTVTTLLNDWLYRGLLVAGSRGWRIPDPARLPH